MTRNGKRRRLPCLATAVTSLTSTQRKKDKSTNDVYHCPHRTAESRLATSFVIVNYYLNVRWICDFVARRIVAAICLVVESVDVGCMRSERNTNGQLTGYGRTYYMIARRTHLGIHIDCLAVALVLEQDSSLAVGDDLAITKPNRKGNQSRMSEIQQLGERNG